MVFSSIIFLFLFLPLVLSVYLLVMLPVGRIGRGGMLLRVANLWLLVTSIFFYTWGEGRLVLVMLASTCLDYACGLAIGGGFRQGFWAAFRGEDDLQAVDADAPRTRGQKLALIASLSGNFALLGFFKYFNFGLENSIRFLDVAGLRGAAWPDWNVVLPMGISFYTFQSISYTIDVYRGRVAPTRSFLDFACYVTMFPQLVAGPIVRYVDVARQLIERKITEPLFVAGVKRFIFGLGKKVLVANIVAVPADSIFALPPSELSFGVAWVGAICYTLQIYFDFSGYSDMAIGLGRMFGFRFPENFNYPYISRSIREFWQRWHISLSTWFRDYLYIPLGGNRVSPLRVYRNLFTVFLLCGFWHGAAWTFIIWGAYHGFFLALERGRAGGLLNRAPLPFRHVYAMLVVVFGWVLFRAENLPHALGYAAAMIGAASPVETADSVFFYVEPLHLIGIAVGLVLSTPIVHRIARWRADWEQTGGRRRQWIYGAAFEVARAAIYFFILLASAASLSAGTHNPFIYFRF